MGFYRLFKTINVICLKRRAEIMTQVLHILVSRRKIPPKQTLVIYLVDLRDIILLQ